jgi:hypothetical protein
MAGNVQDARAGMAMGRKGGWIAITALFGLAVVFMAWDVIDYAAGAPWTLAPLGQRWFELHRESLLLLQPAVERYLVPDLWWGIQWLLERPACLVPAVAGAAVALFKIVRRPRGRA